MWKVYGISNCDTVKKALNWSKKYNVPYQFYDFKIKEIDAVKLNEWVNKSGLDKIINKKSTTWRNLSQDIKAEMDNKKKAIKIIQQQNTIIKRPVIETGNEIVFGFDENLYLKHMSK